MMWSSLACRACRPSSRHNKRRSGGHAMTVMIAARMTQMSVATMSPGDASRATGRPYPSIPPGHVVLPST